MLMLRHCDRLPKQAQYVLLVGRTLMGSVDWAFGTELVQPEWIVILILLEASS